MNIARYMHDQLHHFGEIGHADVTSLQSSVANFPVSREFGLVFCGIAVFLMTCGLLVFGLVLIEICLFFWVCFCRFLS